MDIEKYFEEQKIEPVQDRKDGMDYWTNYELFTYNDLMECMEDLVEKMSVMRSSLELKEKEVMSFKEWTKIFDYKETVKGNFVKRGIEYSKESVHSLYYTEYRNPLIT